MSIYLCGETGIVNRGCEAIIRSTVNVLKQRSGDIYLASFAPNMDWDLTKELGINLISYNTYPTKYHHLLSALLRKIFKYSIDAKFIQAQLFYHLKKNDICLNIGGDTYCYGRPEHSIELNKFTYKRGINNILWCCSIEKEAIEGEVLEDLRKYRYIFAREQLTYNNLIKAGISHERVVKCCDPAFFLESKEVELPKGFIIGNTVGINLSELVIKGKETEAYEAIIDLIKYILRETDMSVCLIPHVYSIKQNICDWPILNDIFEQFSNERVSIVQEELNCEELKWIISKCRFMIAARTHATIAAYSSEIPTIALGYSIKSKGIAVDLFGTEKHFVVPFNKINRVELLKAFSYITNNESSIKKKLHDILPSYRESLLKNIPLIKKLFVEDIEICDRNLCTGCMACVNRCPKKCIKEVQDSNGFMYPVIDHKSCVSCGICKEVCPVANKIKDDMNIPQSYIVYNKNDDIRYGSSSGGVFYSIASEVIKNGGVVFGAAFDCSFKVIHKGCSNEGVLNELCGSKYVQSNIKNTYREAEDALKQGKMVLYSGTPCQIGGLHAYLSKEYDNLITIDIICHGVPSPKAWEQYLSALQKKEGTKIIDVRFRDKFTGWKNYSMGISFEDGTIWRERVAENLYMQAYLSSIAIRPSCYECSFKQVHRISDFTLGDFWGIAQLPTYHNDNRGISVVLVHSDKGRKIINNVKCDLDITEVSMKQAICDNNSYLESTTPNPYRKKIEHEWNKKTFEILAHKYCSQNPVLVFVRKILHIFYWEWKR